MTNQGMTRFASQKRKADEAFESPPSKYQKTNTTAKRPGGRAQTEMPEQLHNTGSNKVFRFLDLPGEIRNRAYEVIADMTDKSFPLTYPHRDRMSKNNQSHIPLEPLPFIGLTQTCISIRKEFRPLWLSTHHFPLYSLASYCKTFFPLRVPKASLEAMKRLTESYHNPAGTLKIWVCAHWQVVSEIMPLLKFRLRFPKYNIHFTSPPGDEEEPMHFVGILINNDNTMWTRYIEQHIITQVLVRGNGQMRGTDRIRIVIKASHALDWMKKSVGHSRHDIDMYAERLGLGPISMRIGFGVDYS